MHIRDLMPHRSALPELTRIHNATMPEGEKRQAARACVDRYLTEHESTALRRAERLCLQVSRNRDSDLRAWVMDRAVIPPLQERSPRFVAGREHVRELSYAHAAAEAFAATAVGRIEGLGAGTYPREPLTRVVEKALQDRRLDDQVALNRARHLTLDQLRAVTAHAREGSARRQQAGALDFKQQVACFKARSAPKGPPPTREEVATGKQIAALMGTKYRLMASVGSGIVGLVGFKGSVYALFARSWRLDDVQAELTWRHTPEGRALTKADKKLRLTGTLKQALYDKETQASITATMEAMKREHSRSLFSFPTSLYQTLGGPTTAASASSSASA
jgi:hypothetical protein